jgi:hypothetical protein
LGAAIFLSRTYFLWAPLVGSFSANSGTLRENVRLVLEPVAPRR